MAHSIPPNLYAMVVLLDGAGITNHDEYSLVHDLTDDERMKTLTLRQNKSIAKDQKKLDEMKKKLHTDDECIQSLMHRQ